MTGTMEEAFEQGRQMAKEVAGKWGTIQILLKKKLYIFIIFNLNC